MSFMEIYKAYGLSQDSKDIRIEDHTLDLEVITTVKEETQEVPKHKFNLTIIKEETHLKQTKEQEPSVQAGMFIINQLYNQKF
jgi:hypothetical protein